MHIYIGHVLYACCLGLVYKAPYAVKYKMATVSKKIAKMTATPGRILFKEIFELNIVRFAKSLLLCITKSGM